MKLEKKQEEEVGGGAEKTSAKQRPRKKIFENIKFEEGVRALREEKEKFMLGEKENSCPNVVKDEESNPYLKYNYKYINRSTMMREIHVTTKKFAQHVGSLDMFCRANTSILGHDIWTRRGQGHGD